MGTSVGPCPLFWKELWNALAGAVVGALPGPVLLSHVQGLTLVHFFSST